jgi:hypothetical protein
MHWKHNIFAFGAKKVLECEEVVFTIASHNPMGNFGYKGTMPLLKSKHIILGTYYVAPQTYYGTYKVCLSRLKKSFPKPSKHIVVGT